MAIPSVALSAPYTVFPLSLPLHQTRTKDRQGPTYRSCYTAPVESRKRKRANGSIEIATAVDGEGVNIYDVRSTQTISSYALQPTTKFTCAPTSTVSQAAKIGRYRRTYAALSAPKKQLVCWEETSVRSEEGQETPVKQHSTSSASKHDIVYIQDLSATARRGKEKDEKVASGLLAVYVDGNIRLFSEDLQKSHWEFALPSRRTSSATVVYAASTSSAIARKSVFSNRSDIALADNSDEIVLLVVTQNATALNVQFISVPIFAGRKSPRELFSAQLSTRGEVPKTAASTFSVHFPTGTLYQLSSTHLTTYDLTTPQPTVITTLPIQSNEVANAHPTSLLRISSSTVLVATNDEVTLYDTKFSSLQASVSIESGALSSAAISRASTPASSGGGASLTGSIFLTTYIQDMDLVIGYAQGGIVGIQLTRSRVEKSGGLLIDSLGRGITGAGAPPIKTGKALTPLAKRLGEEKGKAEKAIKRLRKAKAAGSVAEFEGIFASYVGVQTSSKENKASKDSNDDTHMVNGTAKSTAVSLREQHDFGAEIPESTYKPLRTDFVMAVLSMIFRVTEPSSVNEEQQMTVSMFPPNVLRYLLESGNFSTVSLPLNRGLVKALQAYDPTLRTLLWFLTSLSDLPATEILSAAELALSPSTDTPEGENRVVFEIHRAEIVRIALTRLATFPASTIIKSLKALPSDSLILLIRILENELIVGEESEEQGKAIGFEDIQIVADLLTCTLDAVGMSGLVMTETTDMLKTLKENVGEALEAVEEAAGLKGLIEELFRHVDWRSVAAAPEEEEVDEEVKEAQAEAMLAIAAPPATASRSLTVKKQPVVSRSDRHKRRHDRASAAAYKAALARTNAQRRTVVGHKKMLGNATVSKEELIKQDRPVALSTAKGISPILPLGALALRRIVDPLVGREFRLDHSEGKKKGTLRNEYWRDGLAAGAYSVESMVV